MRLMFKISFYSDLLQKNISYYRFDGVQKSFKILNEVVVNILLNL